MAPKAAAKAAKAAQDAAEPDAIESRRLQDAAFDAGVLSRTRRLSSTVLPPTKLMLRADGKDITKKASHRKGRYLLVFNFQLAPAAAGKLGTLTHLDSKNPIMYLDFPRGRYKLFGTLVFPRNKYLVLKMGQKEVLCEDVLESMVVFSEGWWVGTAEENPEEKKLPEPDWLAQPALHQKYDFSGRDDADSDDAAPRKLQRLGGQKQQRKAQARQQPESHPIDLAASDSDGAAKEPLAARAPKPAQATLDGFLKRTGQAAKPAAKQNAKPQAAAATAKAKPAAKAAAGKRRAAAQSDSEHGSLDAADGGSSSSEEVDDDDAPPSSARPRSQRRAAGEAAKRLRIEDDSEDEDEAAGAASSAEEDSGGASEGSESEGDEYEPSD
ncbi:DNA-binding protein RHL1 [Chlorella vulgaris]